MTGAAPLLVALVLLPSPSPSPRETRVSLDVKDAPIGDLLRVLGEAGSLQIVLDPDIHCALTLRLKEVALATALDALLRACSLGREEENGVVRVAAVARLVQESQEQRRLAEERAANRPRSLSVLKLSYARAEQLAPLLKRLLGPRGDVVFDARTNTLLIVD
jgi:type II secretory pathway component HofQ